MSEKITIVQIGGNIESAKKGDYQIDVKAILTESWQQTLKSRSSINLGLIFSLILGMLVSLLGSNYLGGIEAVLADPQASMFLNIVVTIAVCPFIAGVEMMGVSHAVGMDTKMKMTFSFLQRASWVVLCSLLTSVLISIGFQLFIIPGVFLAVTLSLTIPLVIEKKMMPFKAIVLSIQSLRFKFFSLFYIYFILFLSLIVLLIPLILLIETSIAPLGVIVLLIGMTFLAPTFYNAKGIIYREIFGIGIANNHHDESSSKSDYSEHQKSKTNPDDTFSA